MHEKRSRAANLSHTTRLPAPSGRPSREWRDCRLMVPSMRCLRVSLIGPARARVPATQARSLSAHGRPARSARSGEQLRFLATGGLFAVLHRGTTSNAYLINWPVLFTAYRQMKAVERGNTERYDDVTVTPNTEPKVAGSDAKSGRT